MVTSRDYYDILGVSKDADKGELKKAYRKKALEFHPDRNKAKDAEQKFKEVNEAYEVLSDDKKRQMYDQFGHAAFDPRSSGGFGGFGQGTRTQRHGPFTYTYSTSGFNPFQGGDAFSDPFEIFEQFFGGGGFGRRYQAKPHYAVKVDFMEAVKGTEKKIVHQGKEHDIKIPPGASDGTRIRFQEFDVSVDVQPHETFKRDGYDLFVDAKVPFTKAALGGKIEVPTLDEEITLRVRPGTQPNTMIRLQGKGVPHLRGSGNGDMYVRLLIEVPTNLTRKQKQILEDLDKELEV